MHGNNPARDSIERALDFAVTEGLIRARDSIERALDFAVTEGLIRSWKRLDMHHGNGAKWEVEVHPSVHSPNGLGTYPIRTYQEGNLFCAALASARSGLLTKIAARAAL